MCQLGADLFGRLVEGHGGVDELQAVLHLQHQLLPVDGHLLSAAPDRLGIIVTRLQHHLQETRRNTEGQGDAWSQGLISSCMIW